MEILNNMIGLSETKVVSLNRGCLWMVFQCWIANIGRSYNERLAKVWRLSRYISQGVINSYIDWAREFVSWLQRRHQIMDPRATEIWCHCWFFISVALGIKYRRRHWVPYSFGLDPTMAKADFHLSWYLLKKCISWDCISVWCTNRNWNTALDKSRTWFPNRPSGYRGPTRYSAWRSLSFS